MPNTAAEPHLKVGDRVWWLEGSRLVSGRLHQDKDHKLFPPHLEGIMWCRHIRKNPRALDEAVQALQAAAALAI